MNIISLLQQQGYLDSQNPTPKMTRKKKKKKQNFKEGGLVERF